VVAVASFATAVGCGWDCLSWLSGQLSICLAQESASAGPSRGLPISVAIPLLEPERTAHFCVVSVLAERQFSRHEARAPRTLRTHGGPIRTLLSMLKLATRVHAPGAQAQSAAASIVGRAAELAQLNDWFEQVGRGTRRGIFVSRDPEIGKTTLTQAFAESLAIDPFASCVGSALTSTGAESLPAEDGADVPNSLLR